MIQARHPEVLGEVGGVGQTPLSWVQRQLPPRTLREGVLGRRGFALESAAGRICREAGGRGFALESAAGRICREAGGRATSNVLSRDLDLPFQPQTVAG